MKKEPAAHNAQGAKRRGFPRALGTARGALQSRESGPVGGGPGTMAKVIRWGIEAGAGSTVAPCTPISCAGVSILGRREQ